MSKHEISSQATLLTRVYQTAKQSSFVQDLLVFAGALGLYIRTLCPSIYTFDSAEFVTGAHTLGIIHATGYPLYLLLAKSFTLLIPFGDIAYRVNLFSALCAALSLVLLRRVAYLITGSAGAALLATALLGVTYPFWSQALVAEVYSLHILFLCGMLWLSLRWRDTGRAIYFILSGLCLGLSFGNHMSTILVIPGAVYILWDTLKNKQVASPTLYAWVGACVAFSIGPLSYLYLPIRYASDPVLNYATFIGVDLSTIKGVLWMVRGAMFRDFMFAYSLSDLPNEIWQFIQSLWRTYLGLGIVVAVIGFFDLWRRDRSLVIVLSLIFATNVLFYINYSAYDKETMFLPAFVIVSLWIASGICGLQERLATGVQKQAVYWIAGLLLVILLVMVFPQVDLSDNWITRQYAEEVFQQAPPEAFLIGGWIEILPLQYLQIVEGQRPDITLFDHGLYTDGYRSVLQEEGLSKPLSRKITERVIQLEILKQIESGRPTFSLSENPSLEQDFDLVPVSNWLYDITPTDRDR